MHMVVADWPNTGSIISENISAEELPDMAESGRVKLDQLNGVAQDQDKRATRTLWAMIQKFENGEIPAEYATFGIQIAAYLLDTQWPGDLEDQAIYLYRIYSRIPRFAVETLTGEWSKGTEKLGSVLNNNVDEKLLCSRD